ncbi:MAG: DUF1269 domain-containing protein [Clostridia bacterium]|nr:DUF1269 domain-containing protein [Clostridia bacterium]
MSKTVTGIFADRNKAEKAVHQLRNQGFDGQISIIAKGQGTGENTEEYKGIDMNSRFTGGDSVSDGTATGAFIGGLAGLAVGAGALVIPGLGPIIAAGPIAGLLSGAAAGGIAGGLVDYGIPENDVRDYEAEVNKGSVLAIIKADDHKVDEAAKILKENGAANVKVS